MSDPTLIEKFERLTKRRLDMPRTSAGDLSIKERIQKTTDPTIVEKFERLTKRRFDMPRSTAGDLSLQDRIHLFNDKANKVQAKLEKNPFSDNYKQQQHDIRDGRYGRPEEGSLTEQRGISAGNDIGNGIIEVCEVINDCGYERPDGTRIITFGKIFRLYTKISDTVVGMLLRARRHGLVDFEGEMLYQRRDEDTIITLLKPLDEIKASAAATNDPSRCLAVPKK